MTPDERNKAFRGGQGHCPPPPPPKPLHWPQRLELLKALERPNVTHGKAVTVKINIVGKPKSIISQDPSGAVLVLFQDVGPSSLPKGVPQPDCRTLYAVYIGSRQWRKISKQLRDPNDALVIEGYPTFDKAFHGITVLAQNTTTKKLSAEKLKRIGEG